MLKKILPLFPLFLITNVQAQTCNCKESYQWVKKTFEENDAGYAYILKTKGQQAYELHNGLTLKKVEKITQLDDCLEELKNWVRFFRTDHFRFTKTKEATSAQEAAGNFKPVRDSQFNPEEFKKYLSGKKTIEDIEGIWETRGSTVAIKKHDGEYRGITLSSASPAWKAGDTKFVVKGDLKSGTRYLASFKPKQVDKVRVLGKSVLQLDDLVLKRVLPGVADDKGAEEYYLVKTATSPFGYKRDSNTVYVHINSFNYENKKAIDSLLKVLHNTIVSTPNLIIDLRDCQGGSDVSIEKIIPYLYTNPMRSVMAEFYSTPLNNKIWSDLSKRAGADEEEKETYGKIAGLMNSKVGQFVNIFGKDVEETNLDTIYENPRSVGIIIHENNFSTTEEFILKAKQSKKVKFFGHKTGGALDVSNMIEAVEPHGNFVFEYCISRSLRIPEFPVDDMGIHPDFYLDKSIPENEWVNYTSKILNYSKRAH